jgi:hypothetical protein
MIEKRNIVVDYCLCDSTQLVYVVTNIITVITITNSIAVSISMATPSRARTSTMAI